MTGTALLVIMALVINAVNSSSTGWLQSTVKWLFGSTGWSVSAATLSRLGRGLAVIAGLQLVVLVGYAVWLAISSAPGAGDALALLTTGTLAVPFWVGVVLVGLLVPLALLLRKWRQLEVTFSTGLVGLSSACILAGGLALRAIMTVGGQI